MKVLLQSSNINHNSLKRIITKKVSRELTALTEPCYYPSLKNTYYELLKACGISEAQTTELVKRMYEGIPKEKVGHLVKDRITNFYIFIMYYLLLKNDVTTYTYMMVLFNIRYYENLMTKQIKTCDKAAFSYALDHISKTHLFAREKTISNAIFFLSKEYQKKYTSWIKAGRAEYILAFIIEARTRLSQSIKSFAEIYYKAVHSGVGVKTDEPLVDEEGNEYQKEQLKRGERLIDETVKKITVYRIVDEKAVKEAQQLTKIKINVAKIISDSLRNRSYADNIRLILELFVSELDSVKKLCGRDYYEYVKKLMAIKRSNKKIYFKQQINVLTVKLFRDLNLINEYNSYAPHTQHIINSYVAYYITLVFRHIIC